MRKHAFLVLGILIALTLLVACAPSETPTVTTVMMKATKTRASSRGNSMDLVLAMSGAIARGSSQNSQAGS